MKKQLWIPITAVILLLAVLFVPIPKSPYQDGGTREWVAPDTVIRVFMAWQASDEYVDMEAQPLSAPERVGFTVIEWGGTEVK